MRFSQSFWQAHVPEWATFYLAYDELKKDLKLTSALESDGEYRDIFKVHDKFKKQYSRANDLYKAELQRLTELCQHIIAVVAMSRTEAEQEDSNQLLINSRLGLAKRALLGAQGQIRRLLLFAKANSDAARRIFRKMEWVAALRESTGPTFVFPPDFDVSAALSLEIDISRHLQEIPDNLDGAWTRLVDRPDQLLQPFLINGSSLMSSGQSLLPKNFLHILTQLAGLETTVIQEEKALPALETAVCAYFEKVGNVHISSTQDSIGRLPIHYAAEYGLNGIVSMILRTDFGSEQIGTSKAKQPWLLCDNLGVTPISLAASNDHGYLLDLFIHKMKSESFKLGGESKLLITIAHIAVRTSKISNLRNILESGVDVNMMDDSGQTLLCAAVRRSLPSACKLLVDHGARVDMAENNTGQTPLIFAAKAGDIIIAQLLLKHGADVNVPDVRGWTAMEHAAYRGHMDIVEILKDGDLHLMADNQRLRTNHLRNMDSNCQSHIPWLYPDYQSFRGTYVWISLGSIDATKPEPAIQIEDRRETKYNSRSQWEKEVMYSLSVSSEDRPDISYTCDLPLLDLRINDPWLFRTDSLAEFRLRWTLLRQLPGKQKKLVGSGVALIQSMDSGLRPDKESLVRGATTPLQSPENLSIVGIVRFSFFWVTPRPPPPHLAESKYWEFGSGVGGHRGSGKNKIEHKKLQLGENTAQSFQTAIQQGASFIEFDVQLTKDLVPVVYHDFLISETGTDSPMHTLNFEQFEFINRVQAPRRPFGKRSNSFEADDRAYLEALAERMARTHFNKVNGFKANTRGVFIHDSLISLEDIFRLIPKNVPMNIELKYPMLFECDEWDMELIAIKADLFVSTVLDKVYEHAEGRMLVFSSFSPEICIALSTKQRTYPVFFLSKTSAPKGEVRSECIQQAIHFAKSWGLPGIVTECTPLIRCPRLVSFVQSANLTLTSFGAMNSYIKFAQVCQLQISKPNFQFANST